MPCTFAPGGVLAAGDGSGSKLHKLEAGLCDPRVTCKWAELQETAITDRL
ncbi:MAG: hypothetical protein MUO76_24110 [Anaerolineaceae bacterium]|nr:hypothetical protein [Anaerolineaceae bacterium]